MASTRKSKQGHDDSWMRAFADGSFRRSLQGKQDPVSEPALIIDRQGLAQKLTSRPKSFILFELLQNAWDEKITQVTVTAKMLSGKPVCRITVEDDCPEGFQDLSSVYTMFKTSKKAPDPSKRGRFEMGEKLVLALALRATVISTKGTIVFEGDARHQTRERRPKGTLFTGDFRMTREEFAAFERDILMLAVPTDVWTVYNGHTLGRREVLHTFETTLQTVKADEEGNLGPTQRKTLVKVYQVAPGEKAHIYEMGIPVVETGDKWHYDVQQRVPVNWERNNVPPSYLRTLRVEVLNAMHENLTREDAVAPWVSDAADDARCEAEAIKAVVVQRFGEKAVINDPSDPEGTKIAMSQGYAVIHGGAFSKGAWDNIKGTQALLPAGQVTPSPKPYDPNGRPERVIQPEDWTPDMGCRADFAQRLFEKLVPGKTCYVVIVNEPQASWSANFGEADMDLFHGFRLCLNYGRLGKRWFAIPHRAEEVLDLLLHEYCHHTAKDHLSHEMHETATLLGARLANIALNHPELFE